MLLLFNAVAQIEEFDVDSLSRMGISLHVVELVLAVFICFMSLKFFRITKPLNIFLYIYIGLGFFVISTLLYLVYFMRDILSIDVNFINVYVASRLSLIAMLFVFVFLFYSVHKIMRSPMLTTISQSSPKGYIQHKHPINRLKKDSGRHK